MQKPQQTQVSYINLAAGWCIQSRNLSALEESKSWGKLSLPIQSLSFVWLFATPWTAACQASLFITNSWSLLKFMSIKSVMPSNHLTLCLLLLPPLIFPPASGSFPVNHFFTWGGQIQELQLQYQSFQWIFRTDLLYDGLVGSPCSPRDSQESSLTPQFKSIILWWSAFFMVQLLHPYMTTGKTIALTRQTFISKVMSLLFNMLSRLVIAFLLRNKHLLILWL